MMPIGLSLIALLGSAFDGPQAQFEWTEGTTIRQSGYKVQLAASSFAPSRHRITKLRDGSYTIDGSSRYGVWHLLPSMELSYVGLWFEGKRVPVPASLWSHCYEPHLSLAENQESRLIFSRVVEGGIDISLGCSDGASGYRVTFKLRRNGKHSSQFEGT